MRDWSERIPRNIPGFVCNTTCTYSACEGASDVTSNVHSASRKCERARNSECNCQCDCGEFHGCLLCSSIRDNRTVAIKFFFSAIESAKLFTFSKLKCSSNCLPSRVIRLFRSWIRLGHLCGAHSLLQRTD